MDLKKIISFTKGINLKFQTNWSYHFDIESNFVQNSWLVFTVIMSSCTSSPNNAVLGHSLKDLISVKRPEIRPPML